jgi:hypothetical protein
MTLQMVCRTVENESVIELHGWLSGAEVQEFQKACRAHMLPVRIDLENLAAASPDGILALKEQRARGALLSGASPYIELLLQGQPGEGGRKRGQGSGAR